MSRNRRGVATAAAAVASASSVLQLGDRCTGQTPEMMRHGQACAGGRSAGSGEGQQAARADPAARPASPGHRAGSGDRSRLPAPREGEGVIGDNAAPR